MTGPCSDNDGANERSIPGADGCPFRIFFVYAYTSTDINAFMECIHTQRARLTPTQIYNKCGYLVHGEKAEAYNRGMESNRQFVSPALPEFRLPHLGSKFSKTAWQVVRQLSLRSIKAALASFHRCGSTTSCLRADFKSRIHAAPRDAKGSTRRRCCSLWPTGAPATDGA